jgi:hypothetical protein
VGIFSLSFEPEDTAWDVRHVLWLLGYDLSRYSEIDTYFAEGSELKLKEYFGPKTLHFFGYMAFPLPRHPSVEEERNMYHQRIVHLQRLFDEAYHHIQIRSQS